MKRFVLLLIPVLLFGCGSVDDTPSADTASDQAAQVQKMNGLELRIQSVKDAGQKVKNPESGKIYEAAGTWRVVTLELKNKTSTRQSAKQSEVVPLGARLVDQSGKTYDVDYSLPGYMPYNFHDKPFSPNEARTFKLSFDLPPSAKPDRIENIQFGEEWVTVKFPKPAKKGA